MLNISNSLIASILILQSGVAAGQMSTKSQTQQNPVKEYRMSTQQLQFDALVVRIAKEGIKDVKKIEQIIGIKLVPVSTQGTPDRENDLKAQVLQKESGIVEVHYSRQFEPVDQQNLAALTSVYLSIYFDPSQLLSAENLSNEYEYPVYLLNPSSNNLCYFWLGDVNVYIRHKPASGYEGVSEVLFTWDKNNNKPNFPILLDRRK